jgi:hypothetical protein
VGGPGFGRRRLRLSDQRRPEGVRFGGFGDSVGRGLAGFSIGTASCIV